MIADLTIRYVFYILFCYKKESSSKSKSTEQILFEFCEELFAICLKDFIKHLLYKLLPELIDYAKKLGYKKLEEFKKDSNLILTNFFNKLDFVDKISVEVSTDFMKKV